MKRHGIVVFLLTLAVVGYGGNEPGAPLPEGTPTPAVATLSGNGFWPALACAGCVGSGMALMTSGWGPFWSAAMSARGGALASACVEACVQAF